MIYLIPYGIGIGIVFSLDAVLRQAVYRQPFRLIWQCHLSLRVVMWTFHVRCATYRYRILYRSWIAPEPHLVIGVTAAIPVVGHPVYAKGNTTTRPNRPAGLTPALAQNHDLFMALSQ
jgi:hypothetical protein